MKRKVTMCVLASGLAATAPVLAKPGGGGGGGNAGGHVGADAAAGTASHSEMRGTSRNSGHIGTTTIGRSN